MNQELKDFRYFQNNQLYAIDYATGCIDVIGGRWKSHIYKNIGSLNPDGYERVWCNKRLRMKHRLIYFLYHGHLPQDDEEIDHYDNNRNNNSINNLRILSKSANNSSCSNRKFGRQRTKAEIQKICELLQNTNLSDQAIADQVKYVTRATVRDIKIRRSRKSISQTYSWPHRGY